MQRAERRGAELRSEKRRGEPRRSGCARALVVVGGVAFGVLAGCGQGERGPGAIEGSARPAHAVEASERAVSRAARPWGETASERRVLFGDLHVHTTYSIDAFMYSLPLFGDSGAHPPADACDYARHCAALDFFSYNDHAESLWPERWWETAETVRQCNALAGDPDDPDLVAYLGWEWTQVGDTPAEHYGHKNVIVLGQDHEEVPPRPITSLPDGTTDRARAMWIVRALSNLEPLGDYADFLYLLNGIVKTPDCESGVDTRELPADCRENAETPDVLFEKLAQWGGPSLVIPHGLAWGVHAPPGARLDNQLEPRMHDPERQRLIEVYSGHGNSEEFRDYAEFVADETGERGCPPASADYLPCCRRAAELVRERCGDLPPAECEERAARASRLVLEAGTSPHRVLPELAAADWLDCDQCRDCFKPAATLRPGESAQYATAISNPEVLDANGRPLRFRFGFVGSSDNHGSRPGTGYKQMHMEITSDARGYSSERVESWVRPYAVGSADDPGEPQPVPEEPRGFRSLLDIERSASFLYPGGLVAVHAAGRDRGSIWRALQRREVYGTSGPRILLWFELANGPDGAVPMGGEVELAEAPRFRVRAVGAFRQQPGCPEETLGQLPAERLERLCRGECYHPSDERHAIDAIEVVRIRARRAADEPVAPLIEDPWLRVACEPDPAGCLAEFEDPDFAGGGRDVAYYVRALQEPTPAVNGATLRAERNADGEVVRVRECAAGYRATPGDDCLAPVRERAWSSPIYVDRPLR